MSDDPRPGQPPGPSPAGGEVAAAPAGTGRPLILDQLFAGDSLYALRAAVAAHATAAGVPAGQVPDLVIAVHELATNAIRHGAGHGRLRIWADGGALHCEVTDDGPAAPAIPAERWPAEHGHGLWLIRQVADETSLQSGPGGTVARVSFSLPK
jgi:anti-sigma regulatory factor (Ser/Thr protein kinase)